MPSFSNLPGVKVFCFPARSAWQISLSPALVSHPKIRSPELPANLLKDQLMKPIRLLALANFSLTLAITNTHAQFADSVVSYTPGDGTLAAYQNPNVAMGGPSVYIGYQNADPFNPPYQASDIVALGPNGSITLQFNTPISNSPHPYGLDFIVFGHAGFNEDFSNGTTDGSFFTGGTSTTRVSVSADGYNFYLLNPALAPNIDGLFPTDASGNPSVPVNPALTPADFADQDLSGIRQLYAGSAGGTGFDLAWAVDENNQSVFLPSISLIRLEDLSGTAYLDAISVVPEPSLWPLALTAALGWLLQCRRIKS